MEYIKNINGHFIKPKNSLLWGVLAFAITIGYVTISSLYKAFEWTSFLACVPLIFTGLTTIARSKGIQLFNKSYLKLNDESLAIKVLSQRKRILWKDIEMIDFTENKLRIRPSDKNFQHVSFKNLEPDIVNEITKEISKVAELKNINIKQ